MENPFAITPLSDDEFEFFRSVVYRETGIKLSDMKRSLLQSRLLRRMRELRIATYRDYSDHLNQKYHDELIFFINAVTTNKTEFFRESQHFDILLSTVFPEFESHEKKNIRIWSAGCSTGEEPYSIAMTVFQYYKMTAPSRVKILATDIDTEVLSTAVRGEYKEDQISGMDQAMIRKYMISNNEGYYRMIDEVKKIITFKRLNLLDSEYPMRKKFNCIFCRNVVIYFDKPTQKTLFEKFYDYLEDDGFLFVGHSENLSGLTDKFKLMGRTVYRKDL